MIGLPKYISVGAATAEGGTELTAFDNALLKAGIGNLNLIKVSSVAPKGAKIVPMPRFEPASLVPTVYSAAISSTPGETIAAALAIGLSETSFGMIMEHHGVCTAAEAEAIVRKQLEEAFQMRGMELAHVEVVSAEHTVVEHGCALAAAVLWGQQEGEEAWVGEDWSAGVRFQMKTVGHLLSHRSPYQEIEIWDTVHFGRVLMLDGTVQTTERDGFVYHEMLVHPALLAHPDPKAVLIVGGGDGGALKDVLEHPVERAVLVEIDEEVYRAAREFLTSIHQDAFDDGRAQVVFQDAFEYLRGAEDAFDVILVDSTDPVGPADVLFSVDFYRLVARALRPDGVVVVQSGSAWFQPEVIRRAVRGLGEVFPHVATYAAHIPTYPGGLWTFTAASPSLDLRQVPAAVLEARMRERGIKTRYYTPQLHHAAFVLPAFLARIAGGQG